MVVAREQGAVPAASIAHHRQSVAGSFAARASFSRFCTLGFAPSVLLREPSLSGQLVRGVVLRNSRFSPQLLKARFAVNVWVQFKIWCYVRCSAVAGASWADLGMSGAARSLRGAGSGYRLQGASSQHVLAVPRGAERARGVFHCMHGT